MAALHDSDPQSPAPGAGGTAAAVRPPRVAAASLQRFLVRRRGSQPAWLHEEVARRMAERLPLIRLQPQRLLDWWSEAGGATNLLARQYRRAHRVAVEPLPGDAGAGWRRLLPWRTPAETVAEAVVPARAPVQLVWANMVLHWIDDLPALLARWHAALAVDGVLMVSCFGPDTLRELRALYRECGWGPAASSLVDMHDLGDALVHAGFADPVMDMEVLQLNWPSAAALRAELRTLGANTSPQRFAGLRTPRWLARVDAAIEERLRGPGGRLGLSFEIVYGHAFKPAPRVQAGSRTEVSLETMRAMLQQRPPGPGEM
jgi:malonyl-CoA O-methyltransferase